MTTTNTNGNPPSTTPDRGWCGDIRRGASMGRPTHGRPSIDPPTYVGRVHLDGDYDHGGVYWGAGEPVFEAYTETGDFYATVRAADMTSALDKLRREYPGARFEVRVPCEADFAAFFAAYKLALFWSAPEGEDGVQDAPEEDLAEETLAGLEVEARAFWAEAMRDPEHAQIAARADDAGHDFALTRNHHGVGFWDGGWEDKLGERLTELSHRFPEISFYRSGDGKIYRD